MEHRSSGKARPSTRTSSSSNRNQEDETLEERIQSRGRARASRASRPKEDVREIRASPSISSCPATMSVMEAMSKVQSFGDKDTEGRRDRSTSRRRSTSRSRGESVEEKKKSIREARARSRSRSNTRSSMAADHNHSSSNNSTGNTADPSVSRRRTSKERGSAKNKKKSTQQLILLRHAARCPYGDPNSKDKVTRGPCPIHKHCADMKDLLQHMPQCTSVVCSFPKCMDCKDLLEVVYPGGVPAMVSSTKASGAASVMSKAETADDISSTVALCPTRAKKAAALKKKKLARDIDELMDIAEGKPEIPKQISRRAIREEDSLVMYPPDDLRQTKSRGSMASQRTSVAIASAFLEEDIELGVQSSVDDADDTLEQQSLLQEEINARRLKLAPKSQISNRFKRGGGGASVAPMVTSEIKQKAESIMAKISPGRGGELYDDEGRSFLSGKTLVGRWARISKYCCIGAGLVIIMTFVVVVFMYVIGGDGWHSFQGAFSEETGDNGEFVPVPGSNTSTAPNVPLDVASDATPAPTPFMDGLPAYTVDVLDQDKVFTMSQAEGDASPQTMTYEWIQAERDFMTKEFETLGLGVEEAIEQGKWFPDDQFRNRFGLVSLFYSTTASKTNVVGNTGRTFRKTSKWTHSKNWLSVGISECEWAFYACETGDSLWIKENGLMGT